MARAVVEINDDAIIFLSSSSSIILTNASRSLFPTLQVDFDQRKKMDIGNDCLMSIDGTDFRIPQMGAPVRGNSFASHKYVGKSALRYEIGVSILGGDLVWIQGPYPAGSFNDVKIFNKVLHHWLDPGKRVEAGNGYVSCADKVKCPDNPCNHPANERMQSCVHSRHERINECFKSWGILSQVYCNDITHHGEVFRVIAIIMQLTIENRSPLFQVNYQDY